MRMLAGAQTWRSHLQTLRLVMHAVQKLVLNTSADANPEVASVPQRYCIN